MTDIFERPRDNATLGAMIADGLGVDLVSNIGRLTLHEGRRERLSILIFHRVLAEPDPLLPMEMTAEQFERDIKVLSGRFTILGLSEGLRRLREHSLPPYALCLTFDDGYRDNFTVALPILRRYGLAATFFLTTGYLDSGRMWNDTLIEILRRWRSDDIDLTDWGVTPLRMRTIEDRRKSLSILFRWMRRIGTQGRTEMLDRLAGQLGASLPTNLMLTSDQVRKLHALGMEIGCHTHSHPIFTRITDQAVRQEILESQARIEDLTQARVRYFAFPNGVPGDDYDRHHVELVKSLGFEAAFSTSWGVATAESDPYQLPRFTPWDKNGPRFVLRLLLSRRVIQYPQAA